MENITPMSREELERDVQIQIAAMAARRDSGWCRVPEFFAKTLVARLLLSGLKPYRGAGHVAGPSTYAKPKNEPE
jgi:hypothetical protein